MCRWEGALLLLQLAAVLRLIQPSAAQSDVPTGFVDLKPANESINICTSPYAPIVNCGPAEDPAGYGGYEIALFRLVQQQLGWPDARLKWSCLEWDEMLGHLEAGDGACDLAVAGIDIGRTNLEKGFVFSYPTLSAGYRIMLSSEQEEGSANFWVFLDAFQWQLWLAILLTCIGIGCILWGVERWANIRPPPPSAPPMPKLQPLVFGALGRPMQMFELSPANFAGRFIALIFAFLCFVLTAIYTANTAANLTASQLSSFIRSVEDLPGKRVGTWESPEYLADLAKRGVKARGYPWDSDDDLRAMFRALRKGDIQALVLDSYVLEFAASSQCDLMVIGGLFDEYDQGVVFPSNFDNQDFLRAYNRILVLLKDAGQLEVLQNQWITPPQATCKTKGVEDTTTQITFKSVSGLWILLGAAVGVALVLVVISQLLMLSARHVARTAAWKKSMRHLRTLGGTPGRNGSSGGGNGEGRRRVGWRLRGRQPWEGRNGQGGGAGEEPSTNGSEGGVHWASSSDAKPEVLELEAGMPQMQPAGAPAAAARSMAELLAAMQRVESLLQASQGGQQQGQALAVELPKL